MGNEHSSKEKSVEVRKLIYKEINVSKDSYFCQEKNGLEIRVLKMMKTNPVNINIKQFQLGNSNSLASGKMIFVGETGSGKTTLINSMINNILGVDFNDNFRYSVCDLNTNKRSLSESQTDFVTEYKINYIDGMKRPCNFVFVDTPGLEDTRGLLVQKQNMRNIKEYLTKNSSNVGLVIQSSTNRLTAQLKSVLLDIKALINTGTVQSLIIMSTFAVLNSYSMKDILEIYGIPYSQIYPLNNSALYSKNQGTPGRDPVFYTIHWNVANRCIANVLDLLWNEVKGDEDITGKLKISSGERKKSHSITYSNQATQALVDAVMEKNPLSVKNALDQGADPNVMCPFPSTKGVPVLYYAVTNWDLVVVKALLVDKSININCYGYNNNTPLLHAIISANMDLVEELLLHGVDFNLPSGLYGNTPLLEAIMRHSFNIFKLLLSVGANTNLPSGIHHRPPLVEAAVHGRIDICQLLLQHGASPNAEDSKGEDSIYVAIREGHMDLALLLKEHTKRSGPEMNNRFDSNDVPSEFIGSSYTGVPSDSFGRRASISTGKEYMADQDGSKGEYSSPPNVNLRTQTTALLSPTSLSKNNPIRRRSWDMREQGRASLSPYGSRTKF